MKSVKFINGSLEMAGNLYFPEGFDASRKYAAIVCVHPGGGVKEQTAGRYAEQLAREGFVTLAFDASCQRERRDAAVSRGSLCARQRRAQRGRFSGDARLRRSRQNRGARGMRRRRLCDPRDDDRPAYQGGGRCQRSQYRQHVPRRLAWQRGAGEIDRIARTRRRSAHSRSRRRAGRLYPVLADEPRWRRGSRHARSVRLLPYVACAAPEHAEPVHDEQPAATRDLRRLRIGRRAADATAPIGRRQRSWLAVAQPDLLEKRPASTSTFT